MRDEKIGLSKKILNKTRLKFGVGNLLYNGDEAAFSPFHTIIVRMLGGTDAHLGFIGGAMQSVGPLFLRRRGTAFPAGETLHDR